MKAKLGPSMEDGSPRMELIFEIHHDLGKRHPLGIASVLSDVINALHCGSGEKDPKKVPFDDYDEDAVRELEDLVHDEEMGMSVNPHDLKELATECLAAASWLKDGIPGMKEGDEK